MLWPPRQLHKFYTGVHLNLGRMHKKMKEGIHIETSQRTGKGQARISKQNKIKLTSCKFCNYCHPLKSTAQSKLMLKIQNETQITFFMHILSASFSFSPWKLSSTPRPAFSPFSNKELVGKIHTRSEQGPMNCLAWMEASRGLGRRGHLLRIHCTHLTHSSP